MMHACAACGGAFSCNGGRGSDCTCGEVLRPRMLRKCRSCHLIDNDLPFEQGGLAEIPGVVNPFAPPPDVRFFDVREADLCRCNKCERLHGRVRFI
jgi:hypothetical protein